MRTYAILTVVAVVAAGAFFAGTAVTKEEPAPAAPAPSPDDLMAKMMELGKPGPHHEHLKPFVGEWTAVAKSWHGPGEPNVSEGHSSNQMILGGRFLGYQWKGNMGPMEFQGIGALGYDNFKKEYQAIWMDSMSSSIYYTAGQASEDGKTITLKGTWESPMGKLPNRMVYELLGPDSYRITSYTNMGRGELKDMELTFTRVKK
jgi:hypothetical protein